MAHRNRPDFNQLSWRDLGLEPPDLLSPPLKTTGTGGEGNNDVWNGVGYISLLSRQLDNEVIEGGKPDQPYSLIINIGIHVVILFSILSLMFFIYISGITREHVDKEFRHIINNNMNAYLEKLVAKDKHRQIPWAKIARESQQMEKLYTHPSEFVKKHNSQLLRKVIIAIGVMFGILLLAIVVMHYYLKKNIGLLTILLENLVIFMLIGFIEFMFFKFIASKYVPLNKSDVMNTLIQRIIHNLSRK